MTDKYTNYPESLTEATAHKSADAAKWTPRDVLICALRDIDDGKMSPTCLIVGCAEIVDDDLINSNFFVATPNPLVTRGLLEITRSHISKVQEE